MSGAIDRARQAAEQRADALRAKVLQELAEALPGISRRVEDDTIILRGKGLVRRWIAFGALRFLGRGRP